MKKLIGFTNRAQTKSASTIIGDEVTTIDAKTVEVTDEWTGQAIRIRNGVARREDGALVGVDVTIASMDESDAVARDYYERSNANIIARRSR